MILYLSYLVTVYFNVFLKLSFLKIYSLIIGPSTTVEFIIALFFIAWKTLIISFLLRNFLDIFAFFNMEI